VGEVFARDPDFEAFLASAAIDRNRKAAVLRGAFEGRADTLLVNFLLVLNEHDRLGALRAIATVYRELYDRASGRINVRVASAVPLTDEQQERLRRELREQFRREPVLHTRVDPDLLGGLVVQVGDWVWDASARTQLDEIREQIIERSTHALQFGRNRFSD
jgi:F-type H+-transporting ATPase subunit delta